MAVFQKETLEAYKYADLVKVAKEHDVYRRYAPKAELVEKLLSLNEPVETLNDVLMPSFMESDIDLSDHETENALPQEAQDTSKSIVRRGRKPRKKNTIALTGSEPRSLRSPLSDNSKNMNPEIEVVRIDSPVVVKSKSGTPQPLRRSLAGPAVASKPKLASKGRKLKRQAAVDQGCDEKFSEGVLSSGRRLTRQRTYDCDPPKGDTNETLNLKRQGTFDVDSSNLKRQGTFEVKEASTEGESADVVPPSRSRKLKRDGTFEVHKQTNEVQEVALNPRSCRLRREGTFEVENSSISTVSTSTSKSKVGAAFPTSASKTRLSCLSQTKTPERRSLRPSGRFSLATPGSAKAVVKTTHEQSASRRYFTSRPQAIEMLSSGPKISASKSKIPSVMSEIERKKAEVSAKKIAGASSKTAAARKAPDFNSIHKRLFGKMESLVDSQLKIIDRANSMQKSQQKFCKTSPPANSKVVRKLLSPKAGKSALQHVASSFVSNVVTIQKRPSIRNGILGVSKLQSPSLKPVSKLQSPKLKLQSPKFTARPAGVAGTMNRFGFAKGPELSRKDVVKACVVGKKPVKRVSPLSKAKNMLQTVRLNKRFELQMKHRIAQQTSN